MTQPLGDTNSPVANYGWKYESGLLVPVTSLEPPAPEAVLSLVKSSCKQDCGIVAEDVYLCQWICKMHGVVRLSECINTLEYTKLADLDIDELFDEYDEV